MMLFKLLKHLDRSAFEPSVISLQSVGPVGERILKLGVPVHACAMRPGLPNPIAILRLRHMLRQNKPHIVQTWMYHADLIGGVSCRMAGRAKLVWGIHHSDLDPAAIKRSTILIGRINGKLSRIMPDSIICCSEASRRSHRSIRYSESKMVVVRNGIDLTEYSPDQAAKVRVRQELGIPPDAILIGNVARFHPMKDHRLFVLAAGKLSVDHPGVYYILCGANVDWENEALVGWIHAAGLTDRFRLLGRRDDVARVTAALDIFTLCSASGEGCPLVVCEAMASEVPCVVTDVGDSGDMVGETGIVVKPGDLSGLCDAWDRLVRLSAGERAELGRKARTRAEEQYNIESVAASYAEVYQSLTHGC